MPGLPLIIDCDPGVDDAVALLLALAAPERLDVLAITTVAGNVGGDLTARNACRSGRSPGGRTFRSTPARIAPWSARPLRPTISMGPRASATCRWASHCGDRKRKAPSISWSAPCGLARRARSPWR